VKTAPLASLLGPVQAGDGASSLGEQGGVSHNWETGLYAHALQLAQSGQTELWEVLQRGFEGAVIKAALEQTKGRRMEAAQLLGIGRNTITRKITELGWD
jgi:two-component system nitrogen regulation response regulator GlnG